MGVRGLVIPGDGFLFMVVANSACGGVGVGGVIGGVMGREAPEEEE